MLSITLVIIKRRNITNPVSVNGYENSIIAQAHDDGSLWSSGPVFSCFQKCTLKAVAHKTRGKINCGRLSYITVRIRRVYV